MSPQEHTITPEEAGQRFDRCLELAFGLSSRSEAQHLIQSNQATLNNNADKASRKVKAGDTISIHPSELKPCEHLAEPMPLEVLLEDEHIIAINKPAGMAVHPSKGHHTGTLLNGLLHHCQDWPGINGVAQPGIVHRLDKDTSGIIVFAKTLQAHHSLQDQLGEHSADKRYLAVVKQPWPETWTSLTGAIGPGEGAAQQVGEGNHFKHAHTDVRSLSTHGEYVLVECRLFTGRTHQIRVHLSHAESPIVGDALYGGRSDLARQALHAYQLSFQHPHTNEAITLEAPLPHDIKALLDSSRR